MSRPTIDELNAFTEKALGRLDVMEDEKPSAQALAPPPRSHSSLRREEARELYKEVKSFIKHGTVKQIEAFLHANTNSHSANNIVQKFRNTARGANRTNTINRLKHLTKFLDAMTGITKGTEGARARAHTLYKELYTSSIRNNKYILMMVANRIPREFDPYGRSRSTRRTVRVQPSRSRSATHGGGSRKGHRRGPNPRRKNIPVRGFAVVHSAEKPWVKEANYRRWLAKLKRHTIKVRREGENEAPENMCVDSALCKGDLGIPRKLMPQFTSPRDIRSFTTFAEKRYGIKSRRATRRAANLKPSQEEINRERVEDVQEDIVEKKLNPNVPLIVSRDGYVIDGHHRWAAYKSHHPTKKLPVLLVGAPARDVLSVAATWGAKHHQF